MLQEVEWLLYEEESVTSDDTEADEGVSCRGAVPLSEDTVTRPLVEAWGSHSASFTPPLWNKMSRSVLEVREYGKKEETVLEKIRALKRVRKGKHETLVEACRAREAVLFSTHDEYLLELDGEMKTRKKNYLSLLEEEILSLESEVRDLTAPCNTCTSECADTEKGSQSLLCRTEVSSSSPPLTTFNDVIKACNESAVALAQQVATCEQLETKVLNTFSPTVLAPLYNTLSSLKTSLSADEERVLSIDASLTSARCNVPLMGQKLFSSGVSL
eukprot:TRINITY_DN37189_c0_g1_i1.p1 TRINITY_DN37189_c0_g1~~TRINITY_DN37189_c0_g1_i1.p1  ORF type:complete len:272 (+),score=71.82 TRINITY_DN37189_c0_g1_i1:97-912(+)